jgi:hypothetical protein
VHKYFLLQKSNNNTPAKNQPINRIAICPPATSHFVKQFAEVCAGDDFVCGAKCRCCFPGLRRLKGSGQFAAKAGRVEGDRVSCCFLSNFASRAVCIACVAVSCNADSSL